MSKPQGNMTGKRWEHFVHGADIGIRGIGKTKETAFEMAALAMTAVITDPASVNGNKSISLSCHAPDTELLLIDWLNALVYEMAIRRMLFSRFLVEFEGNRLAGTAWGEPVDRQRHHPAVEIKGATYTELAVHQMTGNGWIAQCVVDV